MTLKLRKLSYPLGVEICDIDVAKDITEGSFGEIYRAFLDNGILLFRNQDITREQHIELSRRFGELDRHDSLPRDRRKDYPELLMVTNEPKSDGEPSGLGRLVTRSSSACSGWRSRGKASCRSSSPKRRLNSMCCSRVTS